MNVSGFEPVDMAVGDGNLTMRDLLHGDVQGPEPMNLTNPDDAMVFVDRLFEKAGKVNVTDNFGIFVAGPREAFVFGSFDLAPKNQSEATLFVFTCDYLSGETYDVYVTSPNADLGPESPDFSGYTYSQLATQMSLSVQLEAGKSYQIRLCKAGTKTVLSDLGTVPEFGSTTQPGFIYAVFQTRIPGIGESSLLYKFVDF